MLSFRRLCQVTSALALTAALASATFQAAPAHAVGLSANAQALPISTTTESTAADPRADLIVIYQGSETHFYGTVMKYTVANGPGVAAQNVVVTKMVKTGISSIRDGRTGVRRPGAESRAGEGCAKRGEWCVQRGWQ